MQSLEIYENKKEYIKQYLEDFKSLVIKLGDIGLNIDSDILKLDDAINTVNSDILSIALIGAFSDGKTTTIAGWLEEIEDNMKISTDESSDEIYIYYPRNIPDKCQIVDTPGLFGYKEKILGDDVVKFSDITKKYISSAHIIFYMVDAINPLKSTHEETIKWILRDLGKLDSTVFIINKMDKVADLTDEEEFNSQKKIKIENVIGKLIRFSNLSDEEVKRLKVVCISANPQERGLDFWLKRKDDYILRSRIGQLQEVTNNILENSIINDLIYKTGLDVIKDTVEKEVKILDEYLKYVISNIEERKEEVKRISEDLERAKKEIIRCKIDFKEELNNYKKNILRKIISSSPDDIEEVIKIDIGSRKVENIKNDENSNEDKYEFGYNIINDINIMFEKYFNSITQLVMNLKKEITIQVEKSNKFLEHSLSMISSNLVMISKLDKQVIKTAVFKSRDILAKIGPVIKFKPWGADKVAKNLGKAAFGIGIALDVFINGYKIWKKIEQEKKFKELKEQLFSGVETIFEEIFNFVDGDDFIKEYAPQILEFEKIINDLHEEINIFENQDKKLKEWKKEAKEKLSKYNIVDADFEIIS